MDSIVVDYEGYCMCFIIVAYLQRPLDIINKRLLFLEGGFDSGCDKFNSKIFQESIGYNFNSIDIINKF